MTPASDPRKGRTGNILAVQQFCHSGEADLGRMGHLLSVRRH